MDNIHMIIAVAQNGVIGIDGEMPWSIPEDMQHFKRTTSGHTVVMGRKTFEGLPNGALPFRNNIVLTTDKTWKADDVTPMHTVNAVLRFAKANPEEQIFIMGGAEIYKAFEEHAVAIHLTDIGISPEGDTVYQVDKKKWIPQVIDKGGRCHEVGIDYHFSFLTKVKERV